MIGIFLFGCARVDRRTPRFSSIYNVLQIPEKQMKQRETPEQMTE
jgi:hypothetical protein